MAWAFRMREVDNPVDRLLGSFSCWFRLKRNVAWLLRFKTCLRDRCGPGFKTQLVSVADLDPSELQTAEKAILEYRQRKCFQEEIEALKVTKSVVMKSANYNLEPFLDSNGLLRVGGRLQQAPISTQARHPVIFPKGNHVSRLIARRVHEVETGHSGFPSLGRRSI